VRVLEKLRFLYYTSIAFDLPANITNVYFSAYDEIIGNNIFPGAPGVNPLLYDITECDKTITVTDLQPNAKCGISVQDACRISAATNYVNGSLEHLRLPAGRNYVLVLANPTNIVLQVIHSAFFTYTDVTKLD